MRKRVIAAVVVGLAGAALLGWSLVHFVLTDRTEPSATASSGSVQPLSPEEKTQGAGRGQKTPRRNDAGPDYPWISAEDLKARVDRGEKVVIVNTRSSLNEPIIKGALEVSEDDIETWADKMPTTSAIVTYCS